MNFFCIDCGLGYITSVKLKRHFQDSHVFEPVKCEKCYKKCRNKAALNNHMNIHRISTCNTCLKTMTNNKISQHRIACSGHTFACEKCVFFTNRTDQLNLHMKKHHLNAKVQFLFECTHCQKKFKQQSRLEAHRNVHTKERSISCALCSKVLSSKKSLKVHMEMIHLNKQITIKQGFGIFTEREKKEQTNVKQCNGCKYTTTHKGTLKKHILRKHIREKREKVEMCGVCEFTSKHEKNIVRHIKTAHQEKKEPTSIVLQNSPNAGKIHGRVFRHN